MGIWRNSNEYRFTAPKIVTVKDIIAQLIPQVPVTTHKTSIAAKQVPIFTQIIFQSMLLQPSLRFAISSMTKRTAEYITAKSHPICAAFAETGSGICIFFFISLPSCLPSKFSTCRIHLLASYVPPQQPPECKRKSLHSVPSHLHRRLRFPVPPTPPSLSQYPL